MCPSQVHSRHTFPKWLSGFPGLLLHDAGYGVATANPMLLLTTLVYNLYHLMKVSSDPLKGNRLLTITIFSKLVLELLISLLFLTNCQVRFLIKIVFKKTFLGVNSPVMSVPQWGLKGCAMKLH